MPAEGRVLPSRAGRRQRPPRRFAGISGPWLQWLAAAIRSPPPARPAQQATQLTEAAAQTGLPQTTCQPPTAGRRVTGELPQRPRADSVDGPHASPQRIGLPPGKPWITSAGNRMPQGNPSHRRAGSSRSCSHRGVVPEEEDPPSRRRCHLAKSTGDHDGSTPPAEYDRLLRLTGSGVSAESSPSRAELLECHAAAAGYPAATR
jgi:hypothetical protein